MAPNWENINRSISALNKQMVKTFTLIEEEIRKAEEEAATTTTTTTLQQPTTNNNTWQQIAFERWPTLKDFQTWRSTHDLDVLRNMYYQTTATRKPAQQVIDLTEAYYPKIEVVRNE